MLQKEETGHEADRDADSLVSAPRTSLRAVEAVEAVDSTAKNSRMEETSNNFHGEQAGVQKAMALKRYMSRNMFALVFIALILTMFADRYVVYTSSTYNAFATSAFSHHSLLSAAAVVSDIAQLWAYPVIAKLEDAIGRAEGFAVATLFHVVGSVMSAACPNVETYIAAGIFNAVGNTGFLLTEQVFVAETVSLANRGLFSAISTSITGIVVLLAGSIAAGKILEVAGWRWGYGISAIVLPVCAAPLVTLLLVLQYKAVKVHGVAAPIKVEKKNRRLWTRAASYIWVELDLLGILLLIAGLALVFVPLSMTGSSHSDKWRSPSLIAMLAIGAVCLACLVVWDGWHAKNPIVPLSLLRRRTTVAACLLGLFEFLSFSLFKAFFPSFLQVAGGYTPADASLVNNAVVIAFQVARLVAGVAIRLSRRPLIWIYVGVPLGLLGQGLMIQFTNVANAGIADRASIVVARSLMGLARGLHHTAALVAVQCDVPDQDLSMANGSIWRATLSRKLVEYLPANATSSAGKIFGSLVVAKSYAEGTAVRIAIDRAYRDSMSLLAIILTACMVPMLMFMFGIRDMDLEEEEVVKQETDES
ncbi:hypothetical protein E4U43_006914 [Claviceps pusilla]|uniref:Major facilitator MirA n=1 Tax=Claviceps pusilla TaxID=123648 RepID=A0A9P7T0Z1_9HYPO|nr:hypothetical protein E4U43_006914 [Claviceps pusilla]